MTLPGSESHTDNWSAPAAPAGASLVDELNRRCFCVSLNDDALRHALETELGQPGLSALVRERCPYLFAAAPVFVAHDQLARMAEVVRAVEAVVALPGFRQQALARAPAIARHDPGGARGVFMGYDFHVEGDRVGLIEVNTNAGGAMFNAVLARAQHACCEAVGDLRSPSGTAADFEAAMVAMFRREWALSGHGRPLHSIAIVDEAPEEQYLYPEFLLFQQLFRRHGLQAVIAAPAELAWRDGALWHGELAIDLVYSRLTDFYLDAPASAALRTAYLQRAVVVTPHPQAHALYADKQNLARLTDPDALRALGVPDAVAAVLLAGIPRTVPVTPANADALWAGRRELFFKPRAGYGSRAAYRGEKLTRRVWQEILAGDYVAQALVRPGTRALSDPAQSAPLKFDLRDYVYDGAVQWTAARLYQGQTTNFRTPGGGFAPVYDAATHAAGSG